MGGRPERRHSWRLLRGVLRDTQWPGFSRGQGSEGLSQASSLTGAIPAGHLQGPASTPPPSSHAAAPGLHPVIPGPRWQFFVALLRLLPGPQAQGQVALSASRRCGHHNMGSGNMGARPSGHPEGQAQEPGWSDSETGVVAYGRQQPCSCLWAWGPSSTPTGLPLGLGLSAALTQELSAPERLCFILILIGIRTFSNVGA